MIFLDLTSQSIGREGLEGGETDTQNATIEHSLKASVVALSKIQKGRSMIAFDRRTGGSFPKVDLLDNLTDGKQIPTSQETSCFLPSSGIFKIVIRQAFLLVQSSLV